MIKPSFSVYTAVKSCCGRKGGFFYRKVLEARSEESLVNLQRYAFLSSTFFIK